MAIPAVIGQLVQVSRSAPAGAAQQWDGCGRSTVSSGASQPAGLYPPILHTAPSNRPSPPSPCPQVFIGSALVPFFAKYTARHCAALKAAEEAASGTAAAAALESGSAGPGSSDSEPKPGGKASEHASAEQSDDAEQAEDDREAEAVYRSIQAAATMARMPV